jgi:hypothetical protein
MKNLLLLSFLALAIGFAPSCKKDKKETKEEEKEIIKEKEDPQMVVQEKQRSILANVSATWCGPCGQNGGPTFKSAISTLGTSEVIPLNIQTGNSRLTPYFKKQGLDNPDSVFIAPIFSSIFPSLYIETNAQGGFSIPSFSMNNKFIGTSNTTSTNIVNNANEYNKNAPLLGVAAKKSITGNKINVDVKSKFFKEGFGEYHWVVLVLEKEVIGYQLVGSTANTSYQHRYNVRASMQNGELYNQNLWGEAFSTGDVAIGKEFTKSFSLNYEELTVNSGFNLIEWKLKADNTAIAVMVWKKLGDKYEFVNGILAE